MGYSYKELLTDFYEDYNKFKTDRNMSSCEALARTLEDSFTNDEIENNITNIAYGEITLTLEKEFIKSKEILIGEFKNIDINKMKEVLTEEEFEDFNHRLKHILETIDSIEVINYARVCWYYKEFNQVVCEFIESQRNVHNVEDLVKVTLQRFARDCGNTNSEKTIVYVILLEEILEKYEGLQREEIQELIDFIQDFKTEDIEEEQLNKKEIEMLAGRINALKETLDKIVF